MYRITEKARGVVAGVGAAHSRLQVDVRGHALVREMSPGNE